MGVLVQGWCINRAKDWFSWSLSCWLASQWWPVVNFMHLYRHCFSVEHELPLWNVTSKLLLVFSFVLTVAEEATHRQWHCDNNLSRARCFAVHSAVNSVSVPACVHCSQSSPHGRWFHSVQACVTSSLLVVTSSCLSCIIILLLYWYCAKIIETLLWVT